MGFALATSPTLQEALGVGMRYGALTSAFVRLALVVNGPEARVEFDDTTIPDDVRPFLVERDMATIMGMLRFVAGPDFWAAELKLELSIDAARCAALGRLFPELPMLADQPANALRAHTEVLQRPLPQADPATAELCRLQCQDLLAHRRSRLGAAATVRAAMTAQPSAMPCMDEIAAHLGVDGRTLHRKLEREGTSYRALADEVRETLAVELPANAGLSVEQVAQRLGYAETASFSRAFKRWRGVPPSHYRRP